MAEVRIVDYDAVQRERQEDREVYGKMAVDVTSAIGGGTSLSGEFTLTSGQPFRPYCVQQPPSKDSLVLITSRFQDSSNELSGLVVDVTVHQKELFEKVRGPVMAASKKFKQVERVNLIEKYQQNG